jgi:hypothetical protein
MAGLDRIAFERHLSALGIAVADDSAESSAANKHGGKQTDRPWSDLRGSARFVGDPFAPAVSEEEVTALNQAAADGE